MQKNTDRLEEEEEEVLPSPVESIIGVWRFSSLLKTSRLRRSLPGHMIHLILDGEFVLNIQGRTFSVTPGDLVYYYESETMEWQANQKKAVKFYSVGFIAPDLPPLPLEQRIFKSTETIQGLFRDLYEAYGLLDAPQRTIRLHALLLLLLGKLHDLAPNAWRFTNGTQRGWWALEYELRRRHLFRPTLEELAHIARWSLRTTTRRCHTATGTSPMKRLQQIRMEEARGLLQFSKMNVSEVATFLGYPRPHEFSREFANYFGSPPSRIASMEVGGVTPALT